MPTNRTSALLELPTEALAYARRGLTVFPLWHTVDGVCQCSDGPKCGSPGKHPRTRFGLTEATADTRQVGRWWAMWPQANIGLPAGGNGLAVIDVDPRHGGEHTLAQLDSWLTQTHDIDMMATRLIRTGSGGLHAIYWQPPGGIKSCPRAFGADAPGVDTRGRGGYIVAPPSVHASGARYQVINNGCSIAPWPWPLTARMEPEPAETGMPPGVIACGPRPATDTDRATVWAYHALLSETKQLADMTAPTGDRNNALNRAAYKLGRRVGAGFLDEESVETALYHACSGWAGHGERELRATIRSGMRAGIANPHPGPAGGGGAR